MASVNLPPHQQLVAPHKWPVVGESSPRRSDDEWRVTISGVVHRPQSWSLVELQQLASDELITDIHCVTRWSKLGVRFGGVFLSRLLESTQPDEEARFLSFIARSDRNHSTSVPLNVALENRAMVALTVDESPLEECHGGPVRVVMPGRYFYKSLKWLEHVEVLRTDHLGYWEADAGYHNNADPWLEERFIASQIDKREALKLIESKDFSGRSLLSLVAAGHDLRGLQARGALLRNADLRACQLNDADFTEANLSNARLEQADLRNAIFRDADLEGANFSGSDLRGSDLTGASLFGASFVDDNPAGSAKPSERGARFDHNTKFDVQRLDALTEAQQKYVRQSMQ